MVPLQETLLFLVVTLLGTIGEETIFGASEKKLVLPLYWFTVFLDIQCYDRLRLLGCMNDACIFRMAVASHC